MKYCKECKYFKKIANTEETNQGICSFLANFEPASLEQDCPFLPHELHCIDCDRFSSDTACMTVASTDLVDRCPGFINKYEAMIEEAVMGLLYQGSFSRPRIDKIMNDCICGYKSPKY